MRGRREFLATVGGVGAVALAGCSDDGGGEAGENEVLVGPDGSLAFQPAEITVSPGTTVTWTFESATHNVSCNPEHYEANELPDGAEPFASYEGDQTVDTRDAGETFEHTFEVTGTYHYVCIPHARQMQGDVIVEE